MSSQTIFFNGHIHTVDDAQPWASAMLVQEGRIAAIGADDILAEAAPDARRVDLGQRTVMPGIHDAHSHLIFAASRILGYNYFIGEPATLDELAEEIRAYWHNNSERGWVIGGVYNLLLFTPDVLTREWLDNVLPGVPIMLHDYSFHNVMANSAVFEAAGIGRGYQAPPGGVVVLDGNGDPTGRVMEQAVAILYRSAPDFSHAEHVAALREAVRVCNQYGITSIQEASARGSFLKAAKELDDADELHANLICHIPWGSPFLAGCDRAEQNAIIADRHRYAGRRTHVDAIKVALDGTSMAPIFSHVPLDPDTDQPITYNLLLDPDELEMKIEDWTREGLIVKAHCTGYGSTRIGLDVYERALHVDRKPGQMHDIAHAHYVSPADKSRFANLGVVAEMSPAIWHIPVYQKALGKAFDFRTLHEHDALMTIGTDWLLPPNPNLFPALAGLLTHGDESIPLELGVRIMTLNGAIAVGQSDRWGSLEVGKDATFIVLDRDIFNATPEEIADTQVLQTVIQGDLVYQR